MKLIAKHDLVELLSEREGPCISLYQPTHRHHPDNMQDSIRFKNLVKQLEDSLVKNYDLDVVKSLLDPLHTLSNNRNFWNHTLDSLALFRTHDMFEVYALQRSVPDQAIVAKSFHLKPLKKYLQTLDRFQVLCVTRDRIKLYEGNRDILDEITLGVEVPQTLEQALGEELTEGHLTVASYNGPKYATPNMYHGHGGKKDEIDTDTERFFRAVDRAIYEYHSKPSGLPLVLAALPEYHHLFQTISHNQQLVKEGVKINPMAVDNDTLRTLAWNVFEPSYIDHLNELNSKFHQAKANGKGSDEIQTVTRAITEGRVDMLLVEADKIIPGIIANESGLVSTARLDNPQVDDLLDDLGELTLKMGGQVTVMPATNMPTSTGVAAIYRY
jgi:hypothetical protein